MKQKEIVATSGAPAPVASYAQAVKAGDLLYLSGQIGLDPGTGQMVTGGIEAETRRVLENLGAILNEAGTSFERVVKCTVYLADMGDYKIFDGVFASYFEHSKTARATVAVAALPRGARVEIDAIALLPSA
jgi:2-iminobutanoate/2-iminopropanoate deaminase